MALRHAVLGELLNGEASGYELSKRFDVSTANFWAATPQQLYRELERLENQGLVAARIVEQQRRPNKRVFRITPAGLEELHAFTEEESRPFAVRDDFLVKLHVVDAGNAEAVAADLVQRLEHTRAKLAIYERLRTKLLDGRSEAEYLRVADRIGPYLTLMRGRAFERENVRWGEGVLRTLAQRQAQAGAAVTSPHGKRRP